MDEPRSAPLPPWWTRVHEAAQLLASELNAAVAHAARAGTYTPPPGSPPPRRRRQPGSLRHLAEVIRTHRLAPGVSADKDDIAAVLSGDPRHLADPALVVAVARASRLISGEPFAAIDADRLVVASSHVSALLDAAREADDRAPRAVPAPRPAPGPRVAPGPPAVTAPRTATSGAQPEVIDAYFTTRRPTRRRPLIAGAISALVLAGITLLALHRQEPHPPAPPAPPAAAVAAVTPLEHGHAPNDYLNSRPLQDALDHGFTSIEADVYLRDGTLVLCHRFEGDLCRDDRGARTTARPFEATYLQGLSARVKRHSGRVYPGYQQPVLLFVEIKCVEDAYGCRLPADPDAAATDENNPLVVAGRIMSALVPYRGMLFHADPAARRWGPVQVVLTGDHNEDQLPAGAHGSTSVRGLLAQQPDRYAFLDGSFAVDRDQYNADLVPVISFANPATTGACMTAGRDPIQTLHWDNIIKAQSTGHHVRASDPADCPDHDDAWTDALYAGVDYLSSKHLPQLGGWLTDNATGGGGGHCALPTWIAGARLQGQYCTLSTGNVPVMSRPDPRSPRVGTLSHGGATWFLGQQPGEPYVDHSTHNYWWAYTRADNGQWGWVSLVYFTDPGPDQSADGLQYGCYDVRPGENDDCHPL
ncbi:hypothetical protein ACPCHT_01670 [Nucisporomicrobium flavum]|uniref:hypothetical protein n=1 Tax=Nucisporomicrobium flavum TaxID=2785915 RepID=UPI003C2CE195